MRAYISMAMVAGAALTLAGCGGSGQQQPGPEASSAPAAATPTSAAPAPAASTAAVAAAGAAPADFMICQSCHSVQPGQNGVGPSLAGVYGRKSASVAGYPYSDALKGLGGTWDDASLDKWLTNPAAMAPGTRMTFAGYPDAAKRASVIAYLKTLK